MTITFQGGTGVSTTGAARGTTSTTVAYSNVSAGRMAVLTVAVKPNTATINTPTDAGGNTWTKLGEGTGGTGSNAADTGQTKVAKFFRVLSGSESGNITCTATSSGSIQGALDVYTKTRASWDLTQYVTASDSTHGTNHSAASGTFGDYGVNDTDWLLVGHSGDTDDSTTATSAPAITQTGSTIGTVAARSEVRNTSGNQGRTATWSAPVTTANSNTTAVTSGFTWSVSSCGPDIVARLREYDEFNTLTDDFASTLSTTNWIASGVAATSGGALVINIAGYSYVQSTGNYRLVNNAVTVHTTDFPTTGSTYYAGMRVGPRGNGGSEFIGIYYHGDGTISFEQTGTGAVSITLDETAHQWIRIKHDGTNVLLQTSPNGSTWTTQRTVLAANFAPWVTTNGCEVVMEGAEGDSWSLDDFNLAPNTSPVSQSLDLRWRSYATVSQTLDLRWKSIATTPVSQTLDLQWRSYSAVSQSLDLRWKSYAQVTTSLDLRWRSSALVSSTVDLRWRSYARVTNDIDLRWRSYARVTKDLDLRWRVYQPVTQTMSLQWRVYQQVVGGIDLRWKSAGVVSQTLDLRWRVAARVSQTLDLRWKSYVAIAPASLDLRWRSAARVSADLDLRWKAAGTVSQTLDLRWKSYVKVTPATLDLRWRSYAPVSQTLDLRWHSYTAVSQTLDLRWRSAARVQQTLDLRWKVYNAVAQTLDLRWKSIGRVSSDLDLRWRQLSSLVQVSQTLDLRWRSAARVSSDLDVRWRTYTPTSATIQMLWRSYQKVTPEDRYLIWRSYARVTSDLDLRWRSRATIAQTLDLRWRSLGRVSSDLDLRWRSLGRVSQTLDLRWKSYVKVTPATLDLRWRSLGRVSFDLDLRWRSVARVSQTILIIWRTQALTQPASTDVFVVERNSRTAKSDIIVYDEFVTSRTNKAFVVNL